MVHSEVVYQKTEWHRVYLFYVFFELALGVFLGIFGFANLGKAGEASGGILFFPRSCWPGQWCCFVSGAGSRSV